MTGAGAAASRVRPYDVPVFYTSWWRARVVALQDALWDEIPVGFLQLAAVNYCGLTTNDGMAALTRLTEMEHADVDVVALCSETGYEAALAKPTPDVEHDPDITAETSAALPETASRTSINHLYHLRRAGLLDAAERVTLVEWGGGYGNAARITRRFDYPPTHIIIDSPIMLGLQHEYLNAVGVAAHVWTPGLPPAPPGTVALVPNGVGAAAVAAHGGADTFMGTWSVDESSTVAHDHLLDCCWYGADRVLLAMQPVKDYFPEAAELHHRLLGLGFRESPTHMVGSVYMEEP